MNAYRMKSGDFSHASEKAPLFAVFICFKIIGIFMLIILSFIGVGSKTSWTVCSERCKMLISETHNSKTV